ncbi:MAG TPA: VanZ family protein [Pyrinomonadaceae bacterium]|nr:VanZ family protein [Pyrinomonadaceae bacterium]
MRLKHLAIVYALFLALLVFLADQRQYQFIFRVVRRTPYADKVGHFLLMGILSLLVNLALSCRKTRVGKVSFLTGSLIVAIVVTLEEFSHIFVRYRSFDLIDLLFDYAGIILFGLLASHLTKLRPAQQDRPS